jgi:hypothetical protein
MTLVSTNILQVRGLQHWRDGNKDRLIAAIHDEKINSNGDVVEGRVTIRNALTHADYDRGVWRRDCDF